METSNVPITTLHLTEVRSQSLLGQKALRRACIYLSILQPAASPTWKSLDGFLRECLFQNNPSGKRGRN